VPGAFERLQAHTRGRLLTLFLVATFAIWGVSLLVNAPLTTRTAPSGIVSFEVAGTLDRASAILQSWGERQRLLAAFGLGLDYLFLCTYSTFFALACYSAGEAARAVGSRMASLSTPLAWGQWVAALFDAVENAALLLLLLGEAARPYLAEIASFCASVKFALIGAGLIFIIWGTGLRTLEELLGRRI
jgi:hypothetical protein